MEQEKNEIIRIFSDILEKEENLYKEKGSSFAYSADIETFTQHIVKALEDKYPNIKIDTENIKNIAALETDYSYCNAEKNRFYKRQSYEVEQNMQEKIVYIKDKLDKEKDNAINNIIQANEISIDNFDEKKFESLRNNGYKGGFTNSVLDFAYKNYCQNKEKEQSIEKLEKKVSSLEEKNTRQEKIIAGDDEAIIKLANNNEQLQDTLKNQRTSITHLIDKLDSADYEMTELNNKIQDHKKKSLFARFIDRVKGFFSKTPRIAGVESSYENVWKQVAEAKGILNESDNNLIETINSQDSQSMKFEEMLLRRDRMKNGQTIEIHESKEVEKDDYTL